MCICLQLLVRVISRGLQVPCLLLLQWVPSKNASLWTSDLEVGLWSLTLLTVMFKDGHLGPYLSMSMGIVWSFVQVTVDHLLRTSYPPEHLNVQPHSASCHRFVSFFALHAFKASSQLSPVPSHLSVTKLHVLDRTIVSTLLSLRNVLARTSVRASLGGKRPE